MLKLLVRSIYSRCDSIAVTSPGFRESVVHYAPAHTRVIYVPQWAPKELLDSALSPDLRAERRVRKHVYFRFAGTIGTMQNLQIVIQAFARAAVQDERLSFEIIGDGSEKESLEQLAHQICAGRVSFRGRLPMRDVMPLLQESDFLVLPLVGKGTVGKTIPAKFQAYLAAARPIFGILAGTVGEIIGKEGLGIVADPSDVNAIERGFLSAASLKEQAIEEISRRERGYLLANFSKQLAISRFLENLSPL